MEAVVDNPGFVRFQQQCLRRFLASQYSEKPMRIRHLKPGTASEGRGGDHGGMQASIKSMQSDSGYRSAVDAAIRPKTIPGMLAAAKGRSRCFLNKP